MKHGKHAHKTKPKFVSPSHEIAHNRDTFPGVKLQMISTSTLHT